MQGYLAPLAGRQEQSDFPLNMRMSDSADTIAVLYINKTVKI